MTARTWLVLALIVSCCPMACGPVGCDGSTFDAKPGTPIINKMTLLQQQPDNPWTVIFSIDFTDTGGDLGDGAIYLYTGGSSASPPRCLSDYFEASDVSFSATQGTIALPIPFMNSVQDGQTVRLQTQIEDASSVNGDGTKRSCLTEATPDTPPLGTRSNCYSIDLDFSVKPVAKAVSQKGRRLAQRAIAMLKATLP